MEEYDCVLEVLSTPAENIYICTLLLRNMGYALTNVSFPEAETTMQWVLHMKEVAVITRQDEFGSSGSHRIPCAFSLRYLQSNYKKKS